MTNRTGKIRSGARHHLFLLLRRHPRLARAYLWVRRHKQAATRWWQHYDKRYTWKWRTANIAAALLIVAGSTLPLFQQIVSSHSYELSSAVKQLVGNANPTLSQQLTYDTKAAAYHFNTLPDQANAHPASPATLAAMRAQLGVAPGKESNTSTYGLTVPTDWRKGVTYTDTNTKLAFTLVPQFGAATGKLVDGHLVFPLDGAKQAVYTLKNNGLKEDIIIPHAMGDSVEYAYTLNLPEQLEAKLLPNGAVGIYSVNPVLYTAQATTSMDAEKLRSARESAPKDYLVFGLPAPVIVDSAGKQTPGSFSLAGTTLTVHARGLEKLHYPLSIDPSVVVTSSDDFTNGNDEGNIRFDTDQISRGEVSGGSITAGWNSTGSGSFTARSVGGSAAYNGYVYWVGGLASGGPSNEVTYAPINSNGTIGSWSSTMTLPAGRAYPAAIPVGGKMYVYGGYTSGTSALSSVIYADINSDGTLGNWTTASTTMNTAVCRFGAASSGGYLYAAGGATGTVASNCGNSSATMVDTIQYAPILANGDIGAWTTSASTYTNARKDPGLAIYNGYAYLSSGTTNGVTTYRDTQIAKIGDTGDVGAWRTSSEQIPTNGKYRFGYRAYNGYLYLSGGESNMTGTLYAPIYANGDIGAWRTSATMATGRYGQGFVLYKGYAYYYGGNDGAIYLNDTGYARVDAEGIAGTSTTTTALGASLSSTTAACSIAYNNYVYHIGGYTGSTYTAQVIYAPINNDGTLGAWTTTNSLASPISGGTGLGTQSCAVAGGRVYTIGGRTRTAGGGVNVASIQYASFNANGTLSSWTLNPTDYVGDVNNQAAVGYNGYIYSLGLAGGGLSDRVYRASVNGDGTLSSWTRMNDLTRTRNYDSLALYGGYLYVGGGGVSGGTTDTVEYVKINDDGTLGTWTTTSSMTEVKRRQTMLAINGYMYAVGGEDNSSSPLSTVEYAKINSDGTLGTWTRSANLTVTFNNSSATAWNDTIYAISGEHNTARSKNVLKLTVNSGGTGTAGSWTTASNNLGTAYPSGIAYNNMFIYDGYLYTVGGMSSSAYIADTWSAPLNADGSTGAWTQQSSMPVGRAHFVLSVWNGYVYACTGGITGDMSSNDCTYAKLQSDGGLGPWSSVQTMSLAAGSVPVRRYASGTAYGGYLYILGGADGSAYNMVYYAPLDSDTGAIGTWQASTSFATARTAAATFAVNGYLYVLGGSTSSDGSSGYLDTVQIAPLNPTTGAVGTWQPTASLVRPRALFNLSVANGYVYVYGGTNATGGLTMIEQAPILASGQLGLWQRSGSSSFSNARSGGTGAIANGYIYLSSGRSSGGTYFSDVQYASLSTIARTAMYSKQIDLASDATIAGITYTGVLPEGSAVTYRIANSNGVFGTQLPASSVPSGNCNEPDTVTRHIWVRVVLDDSMTAVFPDTGGMRASLDSLTVSYEPTHPAPNVRLHGGKTLQEDTGLTPLDTCQV